MLSGILDVLTLAHTHTHNEACYLRALNFIRLLLQREKDTFAVTVPRFKAPIDGKTITSYADIIYISITNSEVENILGIAIAYNETYFTWMIHGYQKLVNSCLEDLKKPHHSLHSTVR